MCYRLEAKEFSYGLEWMLNMWVWKINNKANLEIVNKELLIEIFDEIALCPDEEFEELYVSQLYGMNPEQWTGGFLKPVDWKARWVQHNWEMEEEEAKPVPKTRPVLRDMSS